MPVIAPLTALWVSESEKTMLGDFPPNSSVMRFTVSAALRMISWPTAVEPVKAILSIPGCFTIARPTAPGPVTILMTPAGGPPSSAHHPHPHEGCEVSPAGIHPIELPHGAAAPTCPPVRRYRKTPPPPR